MFIWFSSIVFYSNNAHTLWCRSLCESIFWLAKWPQERHWLLFGHTKNNNKIIEKCFSLLLLLFLVFFLFTLNKLIIICTHLQLKRQLQCFFFFFLFVFLLSKWIFLLMLVAFLICFHCFLFFFFGFRFIYLYINVDCYFFSVFLFSVSVIRSNALQLNSMCAFVDFVELQVLHRIRNKKKGFSSLLISFWRTKWLNWIWSWN